jgi:5-methylcytosine-specific restriction protein B
MIVTVKIQDESYELQRDDILSAARREVPRRVNSYYVEIDGKRFPPKQLLRSATGSKKRFVTAVAVRALSALGFPVVSTEAPG